MPIHLLQHEKSKLPARAQSFSAVTHAGLIALVLLVVANPPVVKNTLPPAGTIKTFPGANELARIFKGLSQTQGRSIGGGNTPIPATSGSLARHSSIQIVRPTIPDAQRHEMLVPPTILDPNASADLTPVENLGFPWMKEHTNSPGPGEGNTIGSKRGNSMGDTIEGAGGESYDNGTYRLGRTTPTCAYCPNPQYTDAARQIKLQGSVTLEVLVGTDGRAQRIQLVKGLGMGLDERATEAVRTWKFLPARDGAHGTVAEWVTIEAVFRLF